MSSETSCAITLSLLITITIVIVALQIRSDIKRNKKIDETRKKYIEYVKNNTGLDAISLQDFCYKFFTNAQYSIKTKDESNRYDRKKIHDIIILSENKEYQLDYKIIEYYCDYSTPEHYLYVNSELVNLRDYIYVFDYEETDFIKKLISYKSKNGILDTYLLNELFGISNMDNYINDRKPNLLNNE